MTYNNNCTLQKEYPKKLIANCLESLPEMILVLLSQTMRIERVKFLSAKTYILQAGGKISRNLSGLESILIKCIFNLIFRYYNKIAHLSMIYYPANHETLARV